MAEQGVFTLGHGRYDLPWRTLGLTGLTLALYLLLGPAPQALVLDREAIAAGEWWRLITGHWVHGDLQHLLLDTAGLFILSLLFERRPAWIYGAFLVAAMLIQDLMLLRWLPWIETYCGLSGLLNALLAGGMLLLWRDSGDRLYLLVLAAAAGKIAVEISLGQALFSDPLWPPLPEAHAFGLLSGALLSIPLLNGRLTQKPSQFSG
ncbi:MAG: rhombosortase [Sedimenticola sp.]